MKYNLSEICDLIRNRRTIAPADYRGRQVQPDMVETMLENARWAPTHQKTQPWRFKVYMGAEKDELGRSLAEIQERTATEDDGADPQKLQGDVANSSVLIAICMDRDEEAGLPEEEEVAAVACAVQNIHLTATAYGLGGCWNTPPVVYTDEVKELLGLAKKDKCLGFFHLGYPAGEWPKSQRKPRDYYVEWIGEP